MYMSSHLRPVLPQRIRHVFTAAVLFLAFGLTAAHSLEQPHNPAVEPTLNNAVSAVFGLDGYCRNLLRDMGAARKSIFIDKYVLGGERGMEVARLLKQKSAEGLDVRILMDSRLGSVGKLRKQVQQVLSFIQEAKLPIRFGATRKGGLLIHRWTEDHNKLSMIDGRIGYVGGTNLADFFSTWNDLMLRYDGPVVAKMVEQFEHDWAVADTTNGSKEQEADQTYPAQGLLQNQSIPNFSTVRMVGTGVGRASLIGALQNAIKSAKSSICVQVHQMSNEDLLASLIEAHRRGVKVRVVMDPANIDDFVPLLHWKARGLFNAYAVNRLKAAGIDVRFVKPPEQFNSYHMKLAIFDERVLFVGSANWDALAMTRACETVMEVTGGPIVDQVKRWFELVWTEQSTAPEFGVVGRIMNFLYRKLY
jgi:cardiolipin synthase